MTEEDIKKFIEEEVAKATYHQAQAMERRIDQFLFDAKIDMKIFDKDYFDKLEIIKQNLNICN